MTPVASSMAQPAMSVGPAPLGISLGGMMSAISQVAIEEQQRQANAANQNQPVIQSLAAHVRTCWQEAQQAKQDTVEQRMYAAMRARRGEYEPNVLNQIRAQGTSEIFMMLTSNKCRGASAWLRDVLLSQGSEKPWSLRPTPVPSLPPVMLEELKAEATQQVAQVIQMTGTPMPGMQLRKLLIDLREGYMNQLMEQARFKIKLMEDKMEDQLVEGGFIQALDAVVDDLVTFPAAFMKGPVVRRKPKLAWTATPQGGYDLKVEDTMVLEWERVDPFMIYPSPSACNIEDGYLIERHKLRRVDLEQLIGVDGYDEDAIRQVLEDYGRGGLSNWTAGDTEQASVLGKSVSSVMNNPEGLIEALQFWGSVSGEMLLDWGIDESEVEDKAKQYPCEIWLVGSTVIKASLNFHPLGTKPYYKACYEDIPGAFWGNSVFDLIKDCQDMCNRSARALADNMAIASGPQVWVNADRLAAGEDITNLYPWKVSQMTSDPMGSTAPPMDFFQPTSNANELMAIYEKFSVLADEYSGIPRYMTGDAPAGGAGRTASGMSMLMTNANKSMKQVISNIDTNVLTPMLERLYFHNMKYSDDIELKGDAQVVARGAASLIAKETAQVRRNEFLAATANPIDLQVVGIEGRAALLREAAKGLDMNPDDVVPPRSKVMIAQQMANMMGAGMGGMGQPAQPGAPSRPGSGQELSDGAPTTDSFQPTKKPQGAL